MTSSPTATVDSTKLISHITGRTDIIIPACITTFSSRKGHFDIKIFAKKTSKKIQSLIKRIEGSNDLKIESTKKKINHDTSFESKPLSSYFTKKNEAKSDIVGLEKELIEEIGIDPLKGYYVPYCIPINDRNITQIAFLIFNERKDAETIASILIASPFLIA